MESARFHRSTEEVPPLDVFASFVSSPINSNVNDIEFISKVLLVWIRRKMEVRFLLAFAMKALLFLVSLICCVNSEMIHFEMKSSNT